jgi:single-strand selective monofunctional uracil DNA glycosylase
VPKRRSIAHAQADELVEAAEELCRAVTTLRFGSPVAYVYNPLDYARVLHHAYLRQWGGGRKRVVFLGMNPGPFGMAQSGVPFGDVAIVRDWLRIRGDIEQPARVHPKRPLYGLQCPRQEISGSRLWGGFRARFGTPEAFFAEHFVLNYCPLAFLADSGRNCTPDQLSRAQQTSLQSPCDAHLRRVVAHLRPQHVVGVGRFAQGKAQRALSGLSGVSIGHIPHPSPASPQANAGWFIAATSQLVAQGIWSQTPAPGSRSDGA